MKNDYSIGLDIGTTSVGWAVIDSNNYEILKGETKRYYTNLETKKNNVKSVIKPLWGVRLFEEATDAKSRRLARGTRRRYDRRRKRISLLQDIFRNEINKVDNDFFNKLKTSFYSPKDINNIKVCLTEDDKLNIFSNNIKNGKEKKYPTIYHLRYELINNPAQKDIRLVYLALHHIIKYRGNFLYNNDNFKVNDLDLKTKLKDLFELIYDKNLFSINIDEINYDTLELIILDKYKIDVKANLKKELKNIIDDKKIADEFCKFILGYKFNILTFFNQEKEDDFIEKISFNDSNYDDNYDKLLSQLNDNFEILEYMKELYDMIFLKRIFKGSNAKTISALMIEKYDKHKKDLKELKSLLKENGIEYKRIFKTTDKYKCIYDKYVNNNIEYDDFKKEIIKSLEKATNNDIKNKILDELNNETFLPRVTSTENGKYPYQFNKDELRAIIKNQGKYYKFLNEEIDNINKIEKILSFRIPYYVGPLNTQTSNKAIKNSNAWLIKKEEYKNEPINIFNFDKVVDKEKTANEFIERMLGHCSYINNEKAMPINSIFYSRYKVISEIKQIKIKIGTQVIPLSKDQIHNIYNDLFLVKERISRKDLENYLKQIREFKNIGDFETSGYQTKDAFASSMKSYIDFFGPNGIFENTAYDENDADNIIKDITIFEDKELLKNKIEREYKDLKEEKINKICKLKYSGWSSLSRKLLEQVYYVDKETKERKNIMDLLYETDENLMQILNNKKYHLQDEINKLNKIENNDKISYDLVKDLATSPKNKRGIYQALKVVEEIVDFMGYAPKDISIEMAREDGIKKRTSSKKEHLKELYNGIKEQTAEIKALYKQLEATEDYKFDDEKVFLYYIQLGRSLYSCKTLTFETLSNDCDVDHILPQSLIKDDSIENKALVFKDENARKRNSFVLPSDYRTPDKIKWWAYLKECGLITAKKEFLLTRKEYTNEQIEGFINRQLVETRQITKHVANILNNFYKKTKIIYLHANLSHNYREKFELYKYRDLNDYHHAHDAYLAICLGIYQDKYINKNINFDELKSFNKNLYENGKYKDLRYGYIINSLDNNLRNENTITGEVFDNIKFNETIENTLYRNDIIVSKKTEIRTGEFYNQTKNSKGKSGVELKKGLDTKLYGSYTSLNPSYAVVVKYQKGINICQKMIGIPILIDVQAKKDINIFYGYIRSLLGLDDDVNISFIKDTNDNILKIPFYTKMSWNKQICSLVGATDKVEVCNAREFKINKNNAKKWKYTLNILLNKKKKKDDFDYIKYDNDLNEINAYIYSKIKKEYDLYKNLSDELKEIIELSNSSIENKEKLIIELLKLLKYNSVNANFKYLDHSMAFGRKHHKTISNATLIIQSAAGLKERTYEF